MDVFVSCSGYWSLMVSRAVGARLCAEPRLSWFKSCINPVSHEALLLVAACRHYAPYRP